MTAIKYVTVDKCCQLQIYNIGDKCFTYPRRNSDYSFDTNEKEINTMISKTVFLVFQNLSFIKKLFSPANMCTNIFQYIYNYMS